MEMENGKKITADEFRIDPATIVSQPCEKIETGNCGECPICSDEAADAEREALRDENDEGNDDDDDNDDDEGNED